MKGINLSHPSHWKISLFMLILFSGCLHEKSNIIYMPDMVYTPAYKAQTGHMLMPPEHTVARDYQPYPYAQTEQDKAGLELKNPVPLTRLTLERGKEMFLVYCLPCHGPHGDGDGTIIPKFPKPPSLASEKIRKIPDGGIYHVMQYGQNLMPSYASQIEYSDRWAIIHYIRAFQKAKYPSEEDIRKFNQEVQ